MSFERLSRSLIRNTRIIRDLPLTRSLGTHFNSSEQKDLEEWDRLSRAHVLGLVDEAEQFKKSAPTQTPSAPPDSNFFFPYPLGSAKNASRFLQTVRNMPGDYILRLQIRAVGAQRYHCQTSVRVSEKWIKAVPLSSEQLNI